jgi:MoaA/NifB/PqqE/SkfB family radical SAM enzyme
MQLISHPVLCNYYLTYRCNATCSFCDIWERPSPYATVESVKANLKDLKKLGVRVIDFTGGEPLLHREIDVLLSLAKEMGFITTLTTNGLLYPKWAHRIRGLVDMLHFSLDSPVEEEHNKSRGVDCFRFVQESLNLAVEIGERPDVLFTVFKENMHHLPSMWEEYALKRGLVLILNPVFEYNQVNTGEMPDAEDLKILSAWGKKKNVFLNDAFIKLRQEGGNQISDPVCKALSTTIVISPENELVLPCYHLGIDSIPIENKLFDLYKSEKVQRIRGLEGRLPGCQGCTVNCYMQPSFTTNLNRFWWLAAPSSLKYNRIKGTWKALIPGFSRKAPISNLTSVK